VFIQGHHILLAYDPRAHPCHYYELNKFFYYLPGGHVEFKESAANAILREIKEETGYKGQVQKFLGILEHAWHFSGDEVCCHTHEINFIFQISIPGLRPPMPLPQQESHVAFRWIPVTDLHTTDLRPEALKTLIPQWLTLSMDPAFHSVMS
jgi:8-oxo-dGTP pyrophosphatase MutT (NUDIX family)